MQVRNSSCSTYCSPELRFLGFPSLLSDLVHTLAFAWTTLPPISVYLSLFSSFSFGEGMLVNAPGLLQWLGFNVSSSRRPSLISPSQLLI